VVHRSLEEVEIIRRRAEAFLRNAERLIVEREWDLAVFNLEQYCQLILKYKLLIARGSYPRTYSLRTLIRILGQKTPEMLELVEDENISTILLGSRGCILRQDTCPTSTRRRRSWISIGSL